MLRVKWQINAFLGFQQRIYKAPFESAPLAWPSSLTSSPAGRLNSSWSYRWSSQPTAPPQYWRRRLCGRWTPRFSSARRSVMQRYTHKPQLFRLTANGTVANLLALQDQSLSQPRSPHSPIAARSCLPYHWSSGHPSPHGGPTGELEGSHSQPESQSKWRSPPGPGSYLRHWKSHLNTTISCKAISTASSNHCNS